ncbi:MAG: hypothetical protein H7A32_02030 [Deltaproteobacteria bacterium]|nr:hypothetical protein [Deltaproteobacteria bacterium]
MIRYLFFFLIMGLSFNIYAETIPEAIITIQGLGTNFLKHNQSENRILLNQVDALGVSPNPSGDVYYDESRGGAFYSIGVELITEVKGESTSLGRLQVIRSPGLAGNQLPEDALYDSDYNVKFGPGADIHLLRELQPFVISSDIRAAQTTIQRKVGVFISKDLAPGRYEATLTYVFSVF